MYLMRKISYSILLLGFLSSTAIGQQKTKVQYVQTVEGIKSYTLENGLKVLLMPDASQNNVITNIIYHVGSKHEGYGEKGMAHLLEHMLFKSTTKLGDIKTLLSEKGGNANGTTWYDRTNYYEIFPSSDENLKWSIEMEADRMLNATLKQSDLDKEFSVVRNEFEIGENDPGGNLMEKVISASYLWHNYGKSTIGSKEDIERVKTPQLRRFYEKYYQPDNAVLIVAGKFDEAKALQYIETYFAAIPKPTRVLDEILTVEPAQDGEKFVEVRRAGDSKNVGVSYHVAAYADKDFAALNALSYILTEEPSGYLYKALVSTKNVAAIWEHMPVVRDASFLYFGFDIPSGNDQEKVRNLIRTELDKVPTIAYTQEDVNRAKAAILKQVENLQNNTIQFAVALTEVVGAGDYRLALLYRDHIENLSLEDIERVAKKYFKSNNRTVGSFIPSKDEVRVKPTEILSNDLVKMTEHYKGKTTQETTQTFEASIPNLQRHYTEGAISNGMKYGVIDKQIKGNKILMTTQLNIGDAKQLEGKAIAGELAAAMLNAGTRTMTKAQIKDRLDQLKSTVSFSFSQQSLNIQVQSYKSSFEETMTIVKDMITNPVFPQAEFEKEILSAVTAYESQLNDPQAVAFTEIARITSPYPKTSIYYTPTFAEQIASLKAVQLNDVVSFHKNLLGANYGYTSVIGTGDQKWVQQVLENTFGKWNTNIAYNKVYPTLFNTHNERKIITIADKENATAIGTTTFKMNKAQADFPALLMANEILGSGGFMTARIPVRLREKEGISYGAGSFIDVPTDKKNEVATWGWYAFLNPSKRANIEQAMQEELATIIKEGITVDELKAQTASWKSSRQTDLGNYGYLLRLSQLYLLYGEPFQSFDDLSSKVEKLTIAEVNAAIKKYIVPAKITSVYAGTFSDK
jgi:zinc protease